MGTNSVEYRKKYYQANKEKIRGYYRAYRLAHKQNIRKVYDQWYDVNRERILERMTDRVECACGRTVNRGHLFSHRKSKRHVLLCEADTPPQSS